MPSTRIDIFTRIKGQRQVDDLSRKMSELQTNVNAVSRSFRDVVQGALAVGAGLVVLAPRIASAFTKPVRAAGDLQFELSGVRALIQGQFEDVEQLEEAFGTLERQARKLGETTQFTASEAAQAMQFLARAGFEATEIYEALPGVLNLAAVESIDLATAADIASNVLTGTGKSTDEFNDVVDILAATTTNANTNLIQLAEALKTAAPVASSAGVDLVELNAILGALGNGGLQASIAGTSLRRIITQLTQPTDQASAALAKLGLSFDNFKDVGGDFVGVIEAVRLLEQNLDKIGGTAERAEVLGDIFGQIATPGVNILLKQGSDNLEKLSEKLDKSVAGLGKQGTAAQIAETRLDNLQGSTTRLSSAFEGLLINVGAPFLDFARALVDGITSAVTAVSNFTQEFPFLSQALISTAAAITALVGVLVGLVSVVGFALIAFTSFAKISAVLTVTLPALSAAFGVLGAAVSVLLGPLALLAAALAIGELLAQTTLGFSLFSLKLSEVYDFIRFRLLKGLSNLALIFQRINLTVQRFLGSAAGVAEVRKNIELIEAELANLDKQESDTADKIAKRLEDARKKKDANKTTSLDAAEERINKKLRDERKAAEEKARKDRLKNEKMEADEKNLLRRKNIENIKQEIAQLTNFSQNSAKNIEEIFNKQRELAKVEFAGDDTKLKTELERLNQEQIAKEKQLERERIAATDRLTQARIQGIEDEEKRAIESLAFRQQKELEQLRRGGTQEQISELLKIQKKQRINLLEEQQSERLKSEIELQNIIEDVRIKTIENAQQKERILFEQRQQEDLAEFENIAREKLKLNEEEIALRIRELEKVQEKERAIFEERQALEARQQSRQLDTQLLDLEFGRTNDPLEQIRIGAEIELNEFRLLQDQKLEELRRFGATEAQIEEQRLLFKQDLAEREKAIRREAFDAQLALGGETLNAARGVSQTLLDLSKGTSKELFAITQGLAIAEATINVARAISNSIGAEGFFGVAKAAIAGAAAAAELAKISAVTLGFNEGGFVPGNTSVNRDTVPAMLTPGEAVIPQARVREFGPDFINGIIRGTIPASIANGAPGKGLSPTSIKTRFNTGGIVSAAPSQQKQQPVNVLVKNELSDDVVMGIVSKPGNFEIIKNKIRDEQRDIFG